MTLRRAVVFLVLLAALAATRTPAVLAADDSPRKQAEEVLDAYQAGKLESTFQMLTVNLLNKPSPKQFSAMVKQAEAMAAAYGPVDGYELVNSKSYGTRIKVLTYAVLHQAMPAVFKFYYYRTPSGWNLASFLFSGEMSSIDK